MGVETAWDFTQLSEELVRKLMGVNGVRMRLELMGESCLPLQEQRKVRENICTSRSFGKMQANFKDVLNNDDTKLKERVRAAYQRQQEERYKLSMEESVGILARLEMME